MHTLIVYDANNRCINCFSDLFDIYVEGNDVFWQDGFAKNIKANFIVVEGDFNFEEDEDISHLISQDTKETLISDKTKIENQTQSMQSMINTIMLDPINIEQTSQIEQMQSMINTMLLGGI